MKESLEKAIYPAFTAKWKREHGQDVHFTSSFAGSETVTNQILQGVKAQVAILSIERDAQRLKKAGFVTSDWHALPQKGIVNKTPFVILVRKGNPKGIHDFPDLAKPGVRIIHPDPVSSGGAQWSILAIYTYELEGLLMREANAAIEIVVPEATIYSEHPAVVVDRNVSALDRPLVDAFMQYLWSEEAQRAFVKFHFRSTVNDALNKENNQLATIKYPFTVDYWLTDEDRRNGIGGWDKAYPEVIEKVFRDSVQKK
jgi:sulfate transport system substrate-binding protein